jgi:hypothetical protein
MSSRDGHDLSRNRTPATGAQHSRRNGDTPPRELTPQEPPSAAHARPIAFLVLFQYCLHGIDRSKLSTNLAIDLPLGLPGI